MKRMASRIKKWVGDLLYFHKGRVIAVTVAVVIVTILTANSLIRPYYDLKVLIWCQGTHQMDVEALKQVLTEQYAFDRNGDGRINVLVKDVSSTLGNSMPETERAAAMQDAETFLYITDQTMLTFLMGEVLGKKGKAPDAEIREVFVDLEELYPNEGEKVNGVALKLKGSRIEALLKAEDWKSGTSLGGLQIMVKKPDLENQTQMSAYRDVLSILEQML